MSNLVSRVVVPRNGVAHLCATQDGQLEALAEAPGDPDARHVLSEDGRFLAVMDRENTRAGMFELLPAAPWLREVLPLSPLPSGCVGHASLAMHDRLLIGGKGPNHEALWQRTPSASSDWMAVPLPQDIMKRGKAVDGLHLLGDTLVVVDDIVTPKWLLLYDLQGFGAPIHRDTIRLPHHTTYERIIHTFLGATGLWCLSKGINHGVASTHLWRLTLTDFVEDAHWGAAEARKPAFASMFDPEPADEATQSANHALQSCVAIAEVGGYILLAGGGLGVIALGDGPRTIKDLQFLRTPGLYGIDAFVIPAPRDGRGVFLVGYDADDIRTSTWLPVSVIHAWARNGSN
ncbi:hypothetical protein [Thermomonas mangrovi]|uniref:hypothetical protein n=1 Tax=Thermomonas mangrovi TaxID=2993316 RepID=UPI002307BB69|nr:hypothetical protein [Thermomonas mangrovi]